MRLQSKLTREQCNWGETTDAHQCLQYLNEGFDDVSGRRLDPSLVIAARAEELKELREHGVYVKFPIHECWQTTSKGPLGVRWVDINKGDEARPNYRSRLVAKEFCTDVDPELYAATPPSECLRILLCKQAHHRQEPRAHVRGRIQSVFLR